LKYFLVEYNIWRYISLNTSPLISSVSELYQGPAAGCTATSEASLSSPGASVRTQPPLALEAAPPPVALTWEGSTELEPRLSTSRPEVVEPLAVDADLTESELPGSLGLPRRMTLSWRQLLPRLFCEAAFYLVIFIGDPLVVFFEQASFTLFYLLE